MSADKKNLAAQCWKAGTEAMSKQNWPYAVEMYAKCCLFVPDNLVYRQTFWGACSKMYGDNKTGAKMASMKLMGPKGRIKKGKLQKDWATVDSAAMEGLQVNPWDAGLLAELGDATKQLGYKDVAALFGYAKAVDFDPKNKEYLQTLAEMLEERGEYTQAAVLWDRVCKIDPHDGNARSRANQAATKHVIDRGGYDEAENSKGVMAAHEVEKRIKQAEVSAANADGPGMSEEADLQRAIRKEPDNKDNYLKLGHVLRKAGKYEEARKVLGQALDISGGDAAIREQVEDCELDLMRKNVEMAKDKADSSKDEQAKKVYAELAREARLREMEVLHSRIARHPQNLQLKFQLAECFYKESKWAEAIPLYQQASQDNRLEVTCLHRMGKCFIEEKKLPLARRQLEKALPKLNPHESKDLFLEVHYMLGRLCEHAKDNDNAESHYSEVLAVDYGYKDTLKRLEKMQGGG